MTQVAKKHLSKKTKKSWRKIEHADVDNYLEDQRLEERIGKISEKANDELFIVDTKPHTPKKQKLTGRAQRQQQLKRPPKCLAALVNESKVTDPITKRNRVRTKEERKHFIAKSIEAVNAQKGIIKKKLLQSVADRKKAHAEAAAKRAKNNVKTFDKDIWEMASPKDLRTDFKSPWLTRKITEHNIQNTGTPTVTAPSSAFHKRSKLMAVQIPHPGLSYNPSFEDHQDLLKRVEEREEKIIKQENHLNRVTTEMFKRVPVVERDIADLKEKRSGLDSDNEEDEVATENSEDENEVTSVNPPVIVKRKDAKARRKQREQKEIKRQLMLKKQEKKKVTDIHRLKFINKDIQNLDAKNENVQKRFAERKEKKKSEVHRLGRVAFEEEEIDINLPEDISGNLRNLTAEGNILKDRYKSLQRRNILAPSKDLGLRRRRAVKRYVRTTHKEIPPQPTKGKKQKQ